MAIQIPIAHRVEIGPNQRPWRNIRNFAAFSCVAVFVCFLIIRYRPSGDISLSEDKPALDTYQSDVLDIVNNETGINASSITDATLISSASGIPPYTSEEWDAWEAGHFPNECMPTSSSEIAPDGKMVPTDFAADCSQMKEILRNRMILASISDKAGKSPQLKTPTLKTPTPTLKDLSDAVSKLKAEDDKEAEVMKQILHLSAMKIKKLQKIRIPDRGPH